MTAAGKKAEKEEEGYKMESHLLLIYLAANVEGESTHIGRLVGTEKRLAFNLYNIPEKIEGVQITYPKGSTASTDILGRLVVIPASDKPPYQERVVLGKRDSYFFDIGLVEEERYNGDGALKMLGVIKEDEAELVRSEQEAIKSLEILASQMSALLKLRQVPKIFINERQYQETI